MRKQPERIFWMTIVAIIAEFLPFFHESNSFFITRWGRRYNAFNGAWGLLLFIVFFLIAIVVAGNYKSERLTNGRKAWTVALIAVNALTCSVMLLLATLTNSLVDGMTRWSRGIFFGEYGTGIGFWIALCATISILATALATRQANPVSTPLAVSDNKIGDLEKLIMMRTKGQISEEEYQVLKSRVIFKG